jgi:hypothetical protein
VTDANLASGSVVPSPKTLSHTRSLSAVRVWLRASERISLSDFAICVLCIRYFATELVMIGLVPAKTNALRVLLWGLKLICGCGAARYAGKTPRSGKSLPHRDRDQAGQCKRYPISRSCWPLSVDEPLRHDRLLRDHFRREPYPSGRVSHGGSSLVGVAGGRGSLPRRVPARSRVWAGTIRKSGNRFSEQIMPILMVRTAARLNAS